MASDLLFASCSALSRFSLSCWDSFGGGAKTWASGSSEEDLGAENILATTGWFLGRWLGRRKKGGISNGNGRPYVAK